LHKNTSAVQEEEAVEIRLSQKFENKRFKELELFLFSETSSLSLINL